MIFLGIGSNLASKSFGSPFNNCIEAIKVIRKKFIIENISYWYESEPVPKSDQPWYVNGVVSISTGLNPDEILSQLLDIEMNFGRVREKKNEARVIDLDLLSYKNLVLDSEFLTLPHPRMHLRTFVLKPILDISSKWKHPKLGLNVKVLLKNLKKNQEIRKLK